MGKIAVIDQEFTQMATELKANHEEILEAYEKLNELMRALSDGALKTEQLTPKIEGLLDGVNSDIISRMKELFTQTETVITDYESVIMNVDTSC
ncbi:hypothetical protein [uncultured Enterococcus sp.]|uniref:hypothetical protein n=1 Tax=uncultured Enterococcus sp. TaxID=167972 RepID=UPI002AA63DFA|nr:hypothetical protein [uncultured Enterococcus sp.]